LYFGVGQDTGTAPNSQRARYDSGSSYYNGDQTSRQSTELLNGKKSAGYNRKSFFDAGRVEPLKGGYDDEEQGKEENWDVFADFNNAGPRYSSAFGQDDASYQPLSHPPSKLNDVTSNIGPVEMVTVPALGPEWKASEMHGMTKRGKREQDNERSQQKWKEWRRGERGLCGKYFSRRFIVFLLFGICIVVGVIVGVCLPRVPGFAFNQLTPLQGATGAFNASIPTIFSHAPANFTFPAYADLQVDTNSNYLPLHFNHLSAQVSDLQTGIQVASGDLYSYTVPAKKFTPIQLPLNFTYIATNDSDATWVTWYDACRNKQLIPGGVRPGLNFRMTLFMKIRGLVGSHQTSSQFVNINCPVELPVSAA